MGSPKHIAHILLSKAHPPEVASTIFAERILHKPLHLRPTSPDPSSQDARAQRRLKRLRAKERSQRRQKPQTLSATEKRILGVHEIPKSAQSYATYVPLHRMWLGYMREILGIKEGERFYMTAQSAGSKLASADFHGAEVTVVRSRAIGMLGLKGIVVKDTRFTFQVITTRNELKTVPKKHTIFRFEIPQAPMEPSDAVWTAEVAQPLEDSSQLHPLVFELHGSQFENRATDRATKKFKQRNMVDL